jgi:hypothetical protein
MTMAVSRSPVDPQPGIDHWIKDITAQVADQEEKGQGRSCPGVLSGSITASRHQRIHPQRQSALGQPAIQSAKAGPFVSEDGKLQGTWSVSPADSGHGGLIWTMPGRSAG